jgi:hypothetical protein
MAAMRRRRFWIPAEDLPVPLAGGVIDGTASITRNG